VALTALTPCRSVAHFNDVDHNLNPIEIIVPVVLGRPESCSGSSRVGLRNEPQIAASANSSRCVLAENAFLPDDQALRLVCTDPSGRFNSGVRRC